MVYKQINQLISIKKTYNYQLSNIFIVEEKILTYSSIAITNSCNFRTGKNYKPLSSQVEIVLNSRCAKHPSWIIHKESFEILIAKAPPPHQRDRPRICVSEFSYEHFRVFFLGF
jgi:hypothetical protein